MTAQPETRRTDRAMDEHKSPRETRMTLVLQKRRTDRAMDGHLATFAQTLEAYPVGGCPLSLQLSMLHNGKVQSCGKCVPCRDGLPELEGMLRTVLDGEGDAASRAATIEHMNRLAELVRDTSDCAIGYRSAEFLLEGMSRFADEYASHVEGSRCSADRRPAVPCIALCPAGVDIPGYIALGAEGRFDDAVNLIREKNPLPSACALICEHPCEDRCRRMLLDDAVNIRGLKEYSVDHAPPDKIAVPVRGADTGRTIAIVGSGPSGLTAAWFLSLMGHRVVIFERHEKLGGMLRYGIPNYRFPKDRLDADVAGILAVGGIEVRTGVTIGTDFTLEELQEQYDAVYIGLGAQDGQTLSIEGSDAEGVVSAVDMLDQLAKGNRPDFTGKHVVIIGGGNVAMDATRTASRCGAASVDIIYRRRREDMTALHHEIEGAIGEGAKLSLLLAPERFETDEAGRVTAVIAQPQMPGPYDHHGRPRPVRAEKPEVRVPADVVIVAVGQAIDASCVEGSSIGLKWGRLVADDFGVAAPGYYAGGDCVTGPSTVIAAIAAGQFAAHRIDTDLGYHHVVNLGIEVPEAKPNNREQTGRVEAELREPEARLLDFDYVGLPMTDQEATQEASRCLRCDHFGCGPLVGGRN